MTRRLKYSDFGASLVDDDSSKDMLASDSDGGMGSTLFYRGHELCVSPQRTGSQTPIGQDESEYCAEQHRFKSTGVQVNLDIPMVCSSCRSIPQAGAPMTRPNRPSGILLDPVEISLLEGSASETDYGLGQDQITSHPGEAAFSAVPSRRLANQAKSKSNKRARAQSGSSTFIARKAPRIHAQPPSDLSGDVVEGEQYSASYRAYLVISNDEAFREFIEYTFTTLQQKASKDILTVWINDAIAPKKQTLYPYSAAKHGTEYDANTHAPWWPREVVNGTDQLAVPYREPNHLRKDQRTKLAVHLMMHIDSEAAINLARTMGRYVGLDINAPYVDLLKTATDAISRTKLRDTGEPDERIKHRENILEELWKVSKARESFKMGATDPNTVVEYTKYASWKITSKVGSHPVLARIEAEDGNTGMKKSPLKAVETTKSAQEMALSVKSAGSQTSGLLACNSQHQPYLQNFSFQTGVSSFPEFSGNPADLSIQGPVWAHFHPSIRAQSSAPSLHVDTVNLSVAPTASTQNLSRQSSPYDARNMNFTGNALDFPPGAASAGRMSRIASATSFAGDRQQFSQTGYGCLPNTIAPHLIAVSSRSNPGSVAATSPSPTGSAMHTPQSATSHGYARGSSNMSPAPSWTGSSQDMWECLLPARANNTHATASMTSQQLQSTISFQPTSNPVFSNTKIDTGTLSRACSPADLSSFCSDDPRVMTPLDDEPF